MISSKTVIDKVLQLPNNQLLMVMEYINTLSENKLSEDVKNRIGIAKNISFPANFDEIDCGTAELFGLN